ncbi:MAG: metal ABC transporter substrate-binding protein [Pseudomonadota bacterium]
MIARAAAGAVCSVLMLWAGALAAQERPSIVAVNYPLSYFAERLAGAEADVTFPVPGDVDPSFWRPSIADISAIQSADLILLNGASFASWIDRVSLPRSKIVNTASGFTDRFINTESITHSHGDGGEHSHEGVASYTWLDPALAALQAEAIAAALIARGIVPEAEIAARLEALKADLEALDTTARAALASAEDVVFIATHPRYQYFARAYGLRVLSLEWEAGASPDAAQLAQLSSMVAESGARVMIWEAAPPQAARAQIADLGLESVVFPPLAHGVAGTGYIDALSAVFADWSALEMLGN